MNMPALPPLIRHVLALTAFCAMLMPALTASVTIALSAGSLKDAAGQPIPQNALVLLVASADGNFPGPQGDSFNGSGERIVFRTDGASLGAFGGQGNIDTFMANLSLGEGWATGQRLALYWYPELTLEAGAPPPGTPYGRFAPPPESTPFGGQPWVTPADGSTISLFFFTADYMTESPYPAEAGLAQFNAPTDDNGNGNGGGGNGGGDNGGGDTPGEYVFPYAQTLPGGWQLTALLGWVNGANAPWYYTPAFGFFRAYGVDSTAIWLYTADDGWIWTSEAHYPYLYHWDTRRWRYLHQTAELEQMFEFIPGEGWRLLF